MSRMHKNLLVMAVMLFSLVLAACGTSPKDYSNASPLSTIKSRVKVEPLWAKPTGAAPDYEHTQLPVTVADGKVYTATRSGELVAYASQKGELLWRRSMGEKLTGGPGIGQGMLFVGTHEAELVALDVRSGAERWRHRIPSEMLAKPLVVGESVIVQTIDGKVSAYKTATGERIWLYERSIPKLTLRGTSNPIVVGEMLLAGFSDGHLVSLNSATGELLWETTIAVPHGRTDLERLVDIDGLFAESNDVVYVSSYQGRVVAVSVADGNVLWARDMSSYVGLTLSGNHIFITDAESKVWALDGRTGATLWRQDKLSNREVSAPAVLDNTVVVADYDGYVHWLSADDGEFIARKNIEQVWSKINYVWEDEEQPEKAFHSVTVPPQVVADTLYVRDNTGALVAFRLVK